MTGHGGIPEMNELDVVVRKVVRFDLLDEDIFAPSPAVDTSIPPWAKSEDPEDEDWGDEDEDDEELNDEEGDDEDWEEGWDDDDDEPRRGGGPGARPRKPEWDDGWEGEPSAEPKKPHRPRERDPEPDDEPWDDE